MRGRENLSQANKISRTYAVLLDALNHHRGKGQQKITVEHVHIHSGGQAVVGVVAPRGGVQPKSEDQAHAPENAQLALSSPDTSATERTLTPLTLVRIQVPQPGSWPQIAAYL